MSAPAAKLEHETEHPEPGKEPIRRSPSSPRGGEPGEPGRHRSAAGQHRAGAGDAAVGDGLPGRGRRDRDGGGDAGAVPAGAGAGQLGGDGGADLDPGGVHLRPGVCRGRGLQSAGLADPQDPVTRGAAVGYTAWVRRAAAHPRDRRRAGCRDDLGVGRADHLRLDRQAPGGVPGGRGRDLAGGGGGRRGCGGPGRAGRGDLRPLPARRQDEDGDARTRTGRSADRCVRAWRPRSAAPGC